jgi:hypothetical protein
VGRGEARGSRTDVTALAMEGDVSQRGRRAGFSLLLLTCAAFGCVHPKSTVPFHEELKSPYYAVVYVYREESGFQSDRSWGVFLDENGMGRLRQGAYLVVHAAPGTHTLYVGGNASRGYNVYPSILAAALAESANRLIKAVEFKAIAGESYYFRCKGSERGFLTWDQAIDTLLIMKYDQGD